ncbi:g4728 [Coccomyxa elongata]
MMRWHLCQSILLGAEGESFQVAKILKLVKEVGMSSFLCERAATKADPSYAQSMMDAFESDKVLDLEKRHVMCAQCEKLCDKLQRCSACQLVGYCSRNCQVKHWKAGQKQACREQQAPAQRAQ